MCATAMQLGEQGRLIRNITLFAVLIYELVGPIMTREALMKAGDIKAMPDEVKNRRAQKLKDAKEHGKREHYRILKGNQVKEDKH